MPNKTNRFANLEDRTTEFAKKVIALCNLLPRNTINRRLTDQLIRSAGSVGANYREANESLGKKDFQMRLRISRKEAKESHHWLELIMFNNPNLEVTTGKLIQETIELRKILSSIIHKTRAT